MNEKTRRLHEQKAIEQEAWDKWLTNIPGSKAERNASEEWIEQRDILQEMEDAIFEAGTDSLSKAISFPFIQLLQ